MTEIDTSDRSGGLSEAHGGYVENVSGHPLAATVLRLEQAIERAGLTIFARIDHSGAAREVGLTMPPTIVLIYGNPRAGTPLMLAAPRVALDLPFRVLVREDDDGRVLIAFHPMAAVLRDAGLADELAARVGSAQAILFEQAMSVDQAMSFDQAMSVEGVKP